MLPYLVLLGMIVAGLLWAVRRAPAPAALSDGSEPAVAYLPALGPGRLRVSVSQLVFTADNGRVLVLERLDITGATLTRDLPDRHVAAPVLAVSTSDEVHCFGVDRPDEWVRRLT